MTPAEPRWCADNKCHCPPTEPAGRTRLTVALTEHGAYLSIGSGMDHSVYLTEAEIAELVVHLRDGAAHKTRRFG